MEGLLRALNMLICAINFPRRKRTDMFLRFGWLYGISFSPPFLKRRIVMNLWVQGMTASTGPSIFRKKLIHGEKFTVYCYVKKRRRRKKADYRTVSHVEKIEQRCTHTWEGKKWKGINQNVNPGDLFSWKDCFLCSLYFFQVCLHWIYMQILK